jgi:glycolate oxidase FAD binding subunit
LREERTLSTYRPADEKQAAEAIAWAAAENQSFEIVAGGSKRALGRPTKAGHILDVSQISGIVNYEAAELILTARPATPLAVIEAELAANRQMLSFEPPDWRALLGASGEPTLGGALACNLAGPRRVRAGAPRDYFLGFSAVNGFGDIWKAGGKVVKNVTGYDMSKLQAGAFGTLSVLTEVTVKVMPKPETQRTIVLNALADEVAIQIMSRALNTPFEVSAVAHLPQGVARRSAIREAVGGSGAVTAIRLEGPRPSVAYRADAIEESFGRGARLEGAASERFWREVGDVQALLPQGARIVWRLCPTPNLAAGVVADVRAKLPSAEGFFDWGGGLVWLSLDGAEAGPDVGATVVRGAMKQSGGGHATLVVAPDPIRETIAVFEPIEGPLAKLTSRIKSNFDPRGVLNPGRMHQGQ